MKASHIIEMKISKIKNLFEGNNIKIILLYILPIAIIFSNALADILLVLTVLIYIFEKKFRFKIENFEYFLLLFFLIPIISSIINLDYNALIKSILYVRFFIFYLLFKDFLENNIKIFSKYLFIIFILVTADVLFQYFFYYDVFGFPKDGKRLSGPFNDEFIVATYLFLLFLFIFDLINKNNIYEFIIINLMIFTFIIIGERIILITFISVVGSYYIFNKFKFTFFYLVSVILFFILLFNLFNLQDFAENFFFRYYDFIDHITNYKESVYYKLFLSSIFIIKENYLFGIGFDQFFSNCNLIIEKYSLQNVIFCSNHSHNYYLEILSETGIFALINFVILLLFIVLQLLNNFSFKSFYFFYFLFFIFPIKTYSSIYSQTDGLFFIITISFLAYKIKLNKPI